MCKLAGLERKKGMATVHCALCTPNLIFLLYKCSFPTIINNCN